MRVGLFVTCLADLMRPSVAFAAVKLLEDAGCSVDVPAAQTCCGQPALNSGDSADARAIAQEVIIAFEGFDAVVGPSGSCMGTLRHDYPAMFADDPAWRARAEDLSRRSHELLSFLVDVLKVDRVDARLRRQGHLPRQLRRPARDGREGAAAPAAGRRAGAGTGGDARHRRVLRLRRHLLRQVPRDLDQDGRRQDRPHRGQRRRTRCSVATSAACSTSPGASSAAACRCA